MEVGLLGDTLGAMFPFLPLILSAMRGGCVRQDVAADRVPANSDDLGSRGAFETELGGKDGPHSSGHTRLGE